MLERFALFVLCMYIHTDLCPRAYGRLWSRPGRAFPILFHCGQADADELIKEVDVLAGGPEK